MKKISYISSIVLIVSTSIFVTVNAGCIYLGFDFEIINSDIIFALLRMIALLICCEKNIKNNLIEKNVYYTVRYKNRKTIIKNDLINRLYVVVLFVSIETTSITIVNYFFYNSFNILNYMMYFSFNILVKFFLVLFGYLLQLIIREDISSIIVNSLITILMTVGSGMYIISQEYGKTQYGIIATVLNKFNIINYLSINRIMHLQVNIIYSVISICALIVVFITILLFYSKRYDILTKE